MTDTALTSTEKTGLSHGVLLTDAAVEKVKSLIAAEPRDDLRLRVAVQAGGCCSPAYELYFDERLLDDDRVVDFDGVEVVVDAVSAPYLDGTTIDYADTVAEQGFTVDNPNASSGCACGGSCG